MYDGADRRALLAAPLDYKNELHQGIVTETRTPTASASRICLSIFVLLAILAIGAWLRLDNIEWDDGFGLHPDERFLCMVANDARLPRTFAGYLNPVTSSWNPYNTKYSFYVYGTLPLTLNKLFALLFSDGSYGFLMHYGRILSAIFDLWAILAVFLTGNLLSRKMELPQRLGPWSAFAYALMVLPIQQSHFFTVDTFTNTFLVWALYFALQAHYSEKMTWILLSGIFWGLATACKISSVYVLPMVGALWFVPSSVPLEPRSFLKALVASPLARICRILVFFGCAYLALRVGDPHFFASANFLNPMPAPKFLANIAELQRSNSYSGGIPFPPAVQWVNKHDVWFALVNIVFFGLGMFQTFCTLTGAASWKSWKNFPTLAAFVWGLAFFLYQSCQFAKSLRYFFILYPFFALLIGNAVCNLIDWSRNNFSRASMALLLCAGLALWPVSFRAIYSRPHTRVTASKWIYENIADRAILTSESWDDGLPLPLPGYTKSFEVLQLPVFSPDDDQKWKTMDQALARADYIVLSSNRGYGAVMPQPNLYPKMAPFYRDLFDGKLNFKQVAQFSSFPTLTLFGHDISFDDQWAEEAFSVYDHPVVTIFRKASVPHAG